MLGTGECPSGISKGKHEGRLGLSQFFNRDLLILSSLGKTARASTFILLAWDDTITNSRLKSLAISNPECRAQDLVTIPDTHDCCLGRVLA